MTGLKLTVKTVTFSTYQLLYQQQKLSNYKIRHTGAFKMPQP